ncbi:barstar family protein [Kribbella sp. NPDC056345]|uniref:barstar family protein n=1 Tax=Kribbella sp. NPDC056345 TaxID=3345789 RepID=UPI0035DF6DCD
MGEDVDLRQLLEPATVAGPPWIYKADLRNDLVRRALKAAPEGAIVAGLDSESMQTLDGFFDVVAREFSFPDYFGRNWPAFDECLSDIYEYMGNRSVVAVFRNSEFLLRCSKEDLQILISIVHKVAPELAEGVAKGEPWDRPPVAFHVVFDLGVEVHEFGLALPVIHPPS